MLYKNRLLLEVVVQYSNKIALFLFLNLCLLANADAGINFGLLRITLNHDGTKAYLLESNYFTLSYAITSCNVNTDGTFSGCFSYKTNMDPLYSFALSPHNTTAYFGLVHNLNSAPGNYITRCNLSDNITCSRTYGLPDHVREPSQIALNPEGTKAYIANNASGDQFAPSITECDINPADTSFTSCKGIIGPSGEMPAAFVFNSKGTVAYYTALPAPFDNSVVHRYTVNSQGEFKDDLTFNFKKKIDDFVLNPAGNKAYIVSSVLSWTNEINRCDVNSTDGSLSNCTLASDQSLCDHPQGITFNSAGTIAYVTDHSDFTYVYKCAIDTDGNLRNCVQVALKK